MVKGSIEPMKLFTVDMNLKVLTEKQKTTTIASKALSPLKANYTSNFKKPIIVTKNNTLEGSRIESIMKNSMMLKHGSYEEKTLVTIRLEEP